MTKVDPKEIIKNIKNTGFVTKVTKELKISRTMVYRWIKRARSIYPRLVFQQKD